MNKNDPCSKHGTEVFVFLLLPGLSMMGLVSAIEALRAVNSLTHSQAYDWRLISATEEQLEAANGIVLSTLSHGDALKGAHYIFACGGLRIQSDTDTRSIAILRQAARRGAIIGALSTGTYLLARGGLLEGYRCTIHWENLPAFREDFPGIDCSSDLFVIDRDRLTCSGGTAVLDMILHLISQRHGAEMARRVANQYQHDRIRESNEPQRGDRLEIRAYLPPKVKGAVSIMEANIEEPLSIPHISKRVEIGTRQLERLFVKCTNMTPSRYYIQLRVERARELLIYTDMPIIDVAVASGFVNASHFSTWYKRVLGTQPRHERP